MDFVRHHFLKEIKAQIAVLGKGADATHFFPIKKYLLKRAWPHQPQKTTFPCMIRIRVAFASGHLVTSVGLEPGTFSLKARHVPDTP